MAKIKNTPSRNIFGDGYQKEITLDNGEKYIIKNTPSRNTYGGGYQQEIKKVEPINISNINDFLFLYPFLLLGFFFFAGILCMNKLLIFGSVITFVFTMCITGALIKKNKDKLVTIYLIILSLISTVLFMYLIVQWHNAVFS